MQCQSCGSNVKQGMKQCPSCGEEVISTFTTSLPREATRTGPLEQPVVMNNGSAELHSSSLANNPLANNPTSPPEPNLPEPNLNGKQIEAPPPSVRPVVPPLMSAIGRDQEKASEVKVLKAESPAAPPSQEMPVDLLRTSGISCRSCKRQLKIGAKFCSICGTSVEPSAFSKALERTRIALKRGVSSLRFSLSQTTLPPPTLILISIAGIFLLIAAVQYLIPTDVDAGSSTPLIYHLRSIEFLLLALIFVVASLVFNKR